jgi:hypothetical protein
MHSIRRQPLYLALRTIDSILAVAFHAQEHVLHSQTATLHRWRTWHTHWPWLMPLLDSDCTPRACRISTLGLEIIGHVLKLQILARVLTVSNRTG